MDNKLNIAGTDVEINGVLVKTVDNLDVATVQKFLTRLKERFNTRGKPDRVTFRFFDGTAALARIDTDACFVVVDASENGIQSRVRIYAKTGMSTNRIDATVYYVYMEAENTILKSDTFLSKEVDGNWHARRITTEAEYIDIVANWGNTGTGFPDLADTKLPGFAVLGTSGYEENDCIYFHYEG